jgi:hypothetical protein
MRPIIFKPNGSFKELEKSGKVSRRGEPPKEQPHPLRLEKDQYIPGYTGYIRGKQHIAGRTYGETTRRALARDYREISCSSPIPSEPNANRRIRQTSVGDSFVSNTFSGRHYHVPGYTGFVPGVRSTFAMSYGSSTSQELLKHVETTRGGVLHRSAGEGFADTARPRHRIRIEPNPLPGGVTTNRPPEMLLPAHLRGLRFLAM